MQDHFPSKLARGDQFCNRVREKALLHQNIEQCRHTVLVAPRRYGKSSLVLKVAEESRLSLASVDLFLAHDDAAITKRILAGIGQAVSQLLSINQKVLGKLQAMFSQFRVSLTAVGFSIEASVDTVGLDAVDQIFGAFTALVTLAKQQQKKVIVFMDEFQDIREAYSAKSIQGAIRHVAQATSEVIFIFSGSHRRLLLELFDDRSKPLYMLCDKLFLERMASSDYWPHLQRLAKQKWQAELPDMIFNKIISLTELHPYYVNLLCHELWKLNHMPNMDNILAAWQQCYLVHEDRLVSDLEKLTSKQQDILKTLALNPVLEPTGHHFVNMAKSSTSTVSQVLKLLLNKDMVYKLTQEDPALPLCKLHQLRILDPLLAYALRKYS